MGAQRRSTQSNSLHVGRSEADRRAMPPDEYRSEGTPSLSEGPYVRGETFWFLLCRLTKGTRRKGETISRRYRRTGYVLNPEVTQSPPDQINLRQRKQIIQRLQQPHVINRLAKKIQHLQTQHITDIIHARMPRH